MVLGRAGGITILPTVMKFVFPLYQFAAIGLLASTSPRADAKEWSVPGDFTKIQAALDVALAGDTVRVGPGTYLENLDFKQKDIDLVSTSGAEATIIDAARNTGVKIGPAGSFTGFTVRNAQASFGAGMEVRGANSLISFNIFEDNAQGGGGFGAAIGMNSSSPVIDSNVFRRNTADNQGLSGVVAMVNGSSPYIANNVFYDNPCRAINVTVPSGAAPVIVNNTMVRNQTGIRVDGRVNSINQVFRNNILADNEVGLEVEFGNNPIWQHNLVAGNGTNYKTISNLTGINGNISADPLFVDKSANNFRLRRESPAIDAGTNMSAPAYDFERESRPVDGDGDQTATADIGADELAFGINLLVDGGDLQECRSPQGNTVMVRGLVFPEGIQLASSELFLNGKPVATSLPAEVTLVLGNNTLALVATSTDGRELTGARTVTVVDTTAPEIDAHFVDRRSGKIITSINSPLMNFATVRIGARDACDTKPAVESVVGTEIKDGDPLRFLGLTGRLTLIAGKLTLKVTATDATGNVADKTVHLLLSGQNPK